MKSIYGVKPEFLVAVIFVSGIVSPWLAFAFSLTALYMYKSKSYGVAAIKVGSLAVIFLLIDTFETWFNALLTYSQAYELSSTMSTIYNILNVIKILIY